MSGERVQVACELVKLARQCPLAAYKNTFMNMAVPQMVLCEPGEAPRTRLAGDVFYTLWDRWEFTGPADTTLQQFLQMYEVRRMCPAPNP